MALTDNCDFYWKLDEASGSRYCSVTNREATQTNTVNAGTGKIGNCATAFYANTARLSCSDTGLPSGTSDRTITAWYKTSKTLTLNTYQSMLVYGTASLTNAVYIAHGYDALFGNNGIGISQYGDAIAITGYNDGNWHFLVVTYTASDGTWRVRIDDSASTSKAMTTSTTLSGTLYFGYDGGVYWDGDLDEVGIWSRVLTAQEQTDLYNGGSGLTYPFGTAGHPAIRRLPSSLRVYGVEGVLVS